MERERQYHEFVRDLPAFVNDVFTPESGAVKEVRIESREAAAKQNFYGLKTALNPHSSAVKLMVSEGKLYAIGAPA